MDHGWQYTSARTTLPDETWARALAARPRRAVHGTRHRLGRTNALTLPPHDDCTPARPHGWAGVLLRARTYRRAAPAAAKYLGSREHLRRSILTAALLRPSISATADSVRTYLP